MLIPRKGDVPGFDVVYPASSREIFDASSEVHLRSSLSFSHDAFSARRFQIVHHRGFWPKQHLVGCRLSLQSWLRRTYLHLSYSTNTHWRMFFMAQSPRASHRSGRDTLASSGSCHRAKAAAFH